MRKIVLFLVFIIPFMVSGQSDPLHITLSCWSNGDTMKNSEMTKEMPFFIAGEGARNYSFHKWELIVYYTNGKVLNSGPANDNSIKGIKLPYEVFYARDRI